MQLESSLHSQPWMIGADFNSIAIAEVSIGSITPERGTVADFKDFLSRFDIRELPMSGGTFT